MTDRARSRSEVDSATGDTDSAAVRADPDISAGVEATDAYEADDGGVVLYDIDNPLAWVEADSAVTLERMA
jgi:hypothetical protein